MKTKYLLKLLNTCGSFLQHVSCNWNPVSMWYLTGLWLAGKHPSWGRSGLQIILCDFCRFLYFLAWVTELCSAVAWVLTCSNNLYKISSIHLKVNWFVMWEPPTSFKGTKAVFDTLQESCSLTENVRSKNVKNNKKKTNLDDNQKIGLYLPVFICQIYFQGVY